MLQGLLEGVSHTFTKNFHFIDSVKAYLSYTLLRACVSPSPVIFQVHPCAFFWPFANLVSIKLLFNIFTLSIVCFDSMQLEYLPCYCYDLERALRYCYWYLMLKFLIPWSSTSFWCWSLPGWDWNLLSLDSVKVLG